MAENPFNDELRALAEVQIHRSGAKGVRLRGGPMDGWLVKQDADALEPDWYLTWPSTVAAKFDPGQYVLSSSGKWAAWKEKPN